MTRGAIVLFTAVGCAAGPTFRPEALEGAKGPDIEIRRLSEHVFLHDSVMEVEGFGPVSANGLIVVGARGAVIVDSSWTPAHGEWLLARVRVATGREALAMVATHFHADRAGGVAAARARGVPVVASEATRALVGDAVTEPFVREAEIDLGGVHLELFFPGGGHSRDNIVVWLREERLLFGGCLVKAAGSNIGNLSDADLAAWPATMDVVAQRYGDAAVVVPGHGAVGDASLITYTRQLAVDAR